MILSDLELTIREGYNAVGETFWSQAEIWRLIYGACMDLAVETKCIERTYTTTTVALQQEYAFPGNTIEIKRVTYDGRKLEPIDFRQDDVLTVNNAATAISGTPVYYTQWDEVLALRPIPDSALTLKIYSVNEPQEITTATTTLEVPSFTHMRLCNFVWARMYAKDKDFNTSAFCQKSWEKDKIDVKRWMAKRKRGDSFASVKDEESLATPVFGGV